MAGSVAGMRARTASAAVGVLAGESAALLPKPGSWCVCRPTATRCFAASTLPSCAQTTMPQLSTQGDERHICSCMRALHNR